MQRTIGVLAVDYVVAAAVDANRIAGSLLRYPDSAHRGDDLVELPAEAIAKAIAMLAAEAAGDATAVTVGIGVPGMVRDGVVEESPNLTQMKGLQIQSAVSASIPNSTVLAINDADAVAAGIAAQLDQLDKLVRVWTLGTGIGYGRYPRLEGVWEGGHCTVTLDPKERYCGCGGEGHLEGIMGQRAMRLRFLDLEPEEVFANAKLGDDRCRAFVKLWHRALAAATSSSIHLDGPGRFYICGPSARWVDSGLLNLYLHEMVKMSSLQGSFFEVIPVTDEMAVIGAAVSAERAQASSC